MFATKICEENNITSLVWENELFVRPDYQGNKIATLLRSSFINYMEQSVGERTLILTRMRDDNLGTIKSAEKVGFTRTGVRKLASQQPKEAAEPVFHEFWYRIIEPKT